jgi:hypothetical protein
MKQWPVPHFRPQAEYLMVGNKLVMDFIGRYETLDADFATVCQRLGMSARLEHLNPTAATNLSLASYYYDDAVVQRAQDVYHRDFELLGYLKKPPI